MPHAATVGNLREGLLMDFFRELIPAGLGITSGVICDAKGRVSRQTDFIVKDDTALPSLELSDSVALVPVEAVYLIAEIKSALKTEHRKKLEADREALNVLEIAMWPSLPEGVEFKIPSVIIAFDSEIAIDTLRNWLAQTKDTVAVCIVGKHTVAKTEKGIETYEAGESKPEAYETLRFAEQLFSYLGATLKVPRGNPLWSAYLRGVDDLVRR